MSFSLLSCVEREKVRYNTAYCKYAQNNIKSGIPDFKTGFPDRYSMVRRRVIGYCVDNDFYTF